MRPEAPNSHIHPHLFLIGPWTLDSPLSFCLAQRHHDSITSNLKMCPQTCDDPGTHDKEFNYYSKNSLVTNYSKNSLEDAAELGRG